MERQRHGLPTRLTDASISKFSLGVTYTLSKRTVLYATGAWTRISDGQNNPTVLGVLLWWLDL